MPDIGQNAYSLGVHGLYWRVAPPTLITVNSLGPPPTETWDVARSVGPPAERATIIFGY